MLLLLGKHGIVLAALVVGDVEGSEILAIGFRFGCGVVRAFV